MSIIQVNTRETRRVEKRVSRNVVYIEINIYSQERIDNPESHITLDIRHRIKSKEKHHNTNRKCVLHKIRLSI